jgi:putative heme iron utilization protein
MSTEARRKGHIVPEVLKERRGSAEEFVEDASVPRASHAEKALSLCERVGHGVLSSSLAGTPFGSVVNFALDADTSRLFFFASKMAEHYQNLLGDARCSVLCSETQGEGDRLATARVTLVGACAQVPKTPERVQRFLAKHASATYVHFEDFVVFELRADRARYIGGFGEMSWVAAEQLHASRPDPVSGFAQTRFAVQHMNEDHADAALNIVRKFVPVAARATAATLLDIDRFGIAFLAVLPDGKRRVRVGFPAALSSPDQVQHAVVALSKAARL